MPLKNTDGSVYRLKSPNPLVTASNFADGKMVLHNMKWQSTIIPDQKTEIQVVEEPPIPEPVPVAIPVKEPEQVKIETPQTSQRSKLSNILMMHCLPATLKEKKDTMYGDTYFTVEYGEKFIFEGIVVSRGDLVFEFWTSKELTPRSIVYPFRYVDNQPFNDFRWWRVNAIQPQSNGWLVEAVFSDFQPDFSS